MEDISVKCMITFLLLYDLTTRTQSANIPNVVEVNLSGSNPTHHISYDDDVSATLDGSEANGEVLSWTWTITTDESMRLKVIFQSFHLRALYSILEFGDGTIPGDDLYGRSYTKLAGFGGSDLPNTVISLTNSLWIRFKYLKGSSLWKYDFNMTVKRVQYDGSAHWPALSLENPTVRITSPNYPKTYPKNSYQLWMVRAPLGSVITVVVTAFDLTSDSPDNHRLLIGDTNDRFLNIGGAMGSWVRWTGKKPNDDVFGVFHYRSQGPSIYVLFTTSYEPGGTGFSLELRAIFETQVTEQPTTSTLAPSTTTDVKQISPLTCVTCVCPSTTRPPIITTTGGAPVNSSSHPYDKQMGSPINELFDLKYLWVIVAAVLVLVFISVSVGCYFQRRMNVNKLLITLEKKRDHGVRSRRRSAVKPVGKFASDMNDVLYEGDESDILPYGPINYDRPSSSYTSYSGRMDGFGYYFPELMHDGSLEASSPLNHTYFDGHLTPDNPISEFKTFKKMHPYVA